MAEYLSAAKEALRDGEVLFPADAVAQAYDQMAAEITERLGQTNPLVLCIMIGGLIPTAEIIRRLDFPLELDYLQVGRYRARTVGGALSWRVSPATSLAGRHVLIIDDVLDQGQTLKQVVDELANQQAAEILTAVLVDKAAAKRDPGVQADIVGLHAPDRYLFGAGMDIHNYFRQLPYIVAGK